MKYLSWIMVLASLVVLLVGCSSPDTQPQQAEEAPYPTPTASVTAPPPTDTPSPSAQPPAPTTTPPPTSAEPAPTSSSLPAAEEPTSTSTPPPTATSAVPPPTLTPSATPVAVVSVKDIQRIMPAEAKALVDSGSAVLYDVRSEAEYQAQHAAGSLSFPDAEMATRYGELPTDKSLVFY